VLHGSLIRQSTTHFDRVHAYPARTRLSVSSVIWQPTSLDSVPTQFTLS